MKKIFIAAFVLLTFGLKAQQLAMFTEYMYNEVTINPAYAGSHEVVSATVLGRRQWVGKDFDGAPQTYSFNIHGPLRNKRIGLGLSLIQDKYAVDQNFNAMASASYIIPFKNSDLHFGLQLGAASHVTDYSGLDVYDSDDQNLVSGGAGILPNLGIGMYYFAKKFYVGISAPQLRNNTLEVSGKKIAEQRRHYFFNTGYVLDLSPTFKFKPTLFFKYVENSDPQFDLTGSFIIKEMFWVGGAFRTAIKSSDAISVLLGFQVSNQFKLGYSYDFTQSSLNAFTNGSHELVLNYRFSFDKGDVVTPRYF